MNDVRIRQVFKGSLGSALLVLLAGCGGSGGGSGNNPFAGAFQGEFLQSDGTMGVVGLNVSSSGSVNATTETTSLQTVNYSGLVSGTGGLTMTGGGTTITGNLSANSASVGGTFTAGSKTMWMTMIQNPAPPASGGSPFAGDFSGQIENETHGKVGIIAFTVTSTGVISGTVLVNDNGTPQMATMSGSVTSGGSVTYNVMIGSTLYTTVTGTWNLSQGAIDANAKNTAGDIIGMAATELS